MRSVYTIQNAQYNFMQSHRYILIIIYIKLTKIKETQQVGLKGPKFLANAFLWGLFLTSEQG